MRETWEEARALGWNGDGVLQKPGIDGGGCESIGAALPLFEEALARRRCSTTASYDRDCNRDYDCGDCDRDEDYGHVMGS